ncbi:hypothetical protein B0T14DRAFT_561450 [Immersiella caudata]|uniref:Uncharacterized protein n=1 Tax=Immersiella caudata TaxID=314043 RepID=A0AA39XHU9_9PEZI|nr:hypothetical protein B0T14DRAFT_561450 [Immersiella caudata]
MSTEAADSATKRIKSTSYSDEPCAIASSHAPAVEGDRPDSATASAATVYYTSVKVFLLSTGDDSGSQVEIKGWIRFPDGTRFPPGVEFERDYPIIHSYAGENGGLGRLLMEHTADRIGLPLGFNVEVYEDDSLGTDQICLYSLNFALPANAPYRDGRVWTSQWWNTEDNRYRVNLWWQVTSSG